MATVKFSADDHQRVSTAIAAAEGNTAGEILAIVTDSSDSYHDVVLAWGIAAMLLTLGWFAALPQQLGHWYDQLIGGGWNGAPPLQHLLILLMLLVTVKFLAVMLLLRWRPLRMALTPSTLRTRRVRRRAIALFKAATERRTDGRTGVLLYLSMAERRAEIVGDAAIDAVTDDKDWADAMAALLAATAAGRPGDGLVAAIEQMGAILSAHFPRDAADRNEIPDKLIEL